MIKTACPLDCFDACSVIYDKESSKLVAGNDLELTNGWLCDHLNSHFQKSNRITKPMVNGKVVSLSQALDAVADSIKDNEWLLWRGSGNMGVMQEVTNLLASKSQGVLTRGSLCDSAGEAGIVAGRGVNKNLPLHQIKKSEVVVVWGRNITVTNPHLMPYIKDKTVIVIDPVKTKVAQEACLHLQIKPRSDFYLATILARFIMMEGAEDQEWLEKWASEYEDYYDFTRGFRIKAILEHIGLSLDDIGDLLLMLHKKKVVFLVGAGVQRYEIGDMTLRAIDSLAAILGLFGKEGCGVSYLGDSKLGFDNPFKINSKTELKPLVSFGKYKSAIIQGGNPAHSMPNTNSVLNELKQVQNLIYFGLYENQTSKLANIIIPAKNFLEKDDIRLSYAHEWVQKMNKALDCDFAISEYDFTQEILKRLNKEPIKDEEFYLEYWLSQAIEQNSKFLSPAYEDTPYSSGFGEDGNEEFEFNDDFYDDFEDAKILQRFRKKQNTKSNTYYLLTPKSPNSLNSQFAKNDNYIYIHPDNNFIDNQEVNIDSKFGNLILRVKNSKNIRKDCVLIYMQTEGVNALTSNIISNDGDMACYGDIKVTIESKLNN